MSDSVRLKWLLSESDVRAGVEAEALPLLSVSISWGVRRREAAGTTTRAAAEDLSNYKICRAGDLVINRMRAFQGALGIAPEDGIVSPDYAVLGVDPTIDSRWLNYFLTSGSTVATMARLVRGIGGTEAGNVRTPRLNIADLLSMTAPLVSAEEQRVIADYLDRETARIDTLIEEQQRLIEMLRERRASVVTSALTPTDSWRRLRIKHIGQTSLGKMLDAGRAVREGDEFRPYVRAADVRADGSVNLVDLNEMPFSEAELGTFDLRFGDVLLIEGGATVGRPGFMFDSAPGIAFQKTVNRLRVDPQVDARFVYWSMLRLYESAYYANHYGSVSFVHLTGEKLREIALPFPPIDEQRRLAAHLDETTKRIDTLIAETQRFIELVHERRSVLITAVVTGQIDVREAA
ncbi:restriction endonuclease subunit S [Streptomycetaceae bacterium NBC_01309]